MIITRRQFIAAAVPATLIIPVLTDELLHPGRKFFLPARKVFTGEPAIVVPRMEYTLVNHRYTGRDGRLHNSSFWVRHETLVQLQAAIAAGIDAHQARVNTEHHVRTDTWAPDPFIALPMADERLITVT
jgi:hypothetical protein